MIIGIHLTQHRRNGVEEQLEIFSLVRRLLQRRLVEHQDLVVAAPERQAGMVTDAARLVGHFALHRRDEGTVGWVAAAGEHVVVPDQQAHFVAQVVEGIVFVDAAALKFKVEGTCPVN